MHSNSFQHFKLLVEKLQVKGEGKVKKAMKESFKILNEVSACWCLRGCIFIHIEILIYQKALGVRRQQQKAGVVYVTRQ